MSTDIPDLIAGALGVSRGTAYDMMRDVLAEQTAQQQGPVAWVLSNSRGIVFSSKYPMQKWKEQAEQMASQHSGKVSVTPLYTSPPAQRKPLTFSKLCDIEYEITHRDGDFSILKFARAIEAAHGIKE